MDGAPGQFQNLVRIAGVETFFWMALLRPSLDRPKPQYIRQADSTTCEGAVGRNVPSNYPSVFSWDIHSYLHSGVFYRFFHPPRCPGAPPLDRGAGPNSGPDWRESVGWKILLPVAGRSSREGLRDSARSGR